MLVFVGTIAPGLVALVITPRAGGVPSLAALLHRLFQWRASALWYLFAVGYMAAIKLTVAVTHRVLTGSCPPFTHQSFAIIASKCEDYLGYC